MSVKLFTPRLFVGCNNLFDKLNILQWLSSNMKNRVLIITTKYSPLITFHHPSKCKMKFYFLSFSIALIASSSNNNNDDDDRMRKISIQKKLLKIASTSISFPAISKSLSLSHSFTHSLALSKPGRFAIVVTVAGELNNFCCIKALIVLSFQSTIFHLQKMQFFLPVHSFRVREGEGEGNCISFA